MKLHIELDTNEPLNERDKAILTSVIGEKTVAKMNVDLDADKVVNDLKKEIETIVPDSEKPVELNLNDTVINDGGGDEEKKTAATATEPAGVTDAKDDGTQSPADAITEPVQNATEADGVELDADNLPWDGRIHASTKKQNKDGTWKRRRGIEDDTYNQVVEELKQTMSAGKSEKPEHASEKPEHASEQVKVAPPPPAAATAEHPKANFNTLLSKVTTLRNAGRMNEAEYSSLYKKYDLPNFPAFSQRPDLIPQILEELKRYG